MNNSMENEKVVGNKPWTEEEDKTLRTYFTFGGVTEARKHLNRTDNAINKRAQYLKIKREKRPKSPSKNVENKRKKEIFDKKVYMPIMLVLKELNETDYLNSLADKDNTVWLNNAIFSMFSNETIGTYAIGTFCILALNHKENRNAWISIEEIVDINNRSDCLTRKALHQLMVQGYIEEKNGWRAKGIPNTYRLNSKKNNILNTFPVPSKLLHAIIMNKFCGRKMLVLLNMYHTAYNEAKKTTQTTNKYKAIYYACEVVGSKTGTTRTTVNVHTNELVKENYIQKSKNYIAIDSVSPNRQELQNYVNEQTTKLIALAITADETENNWYGNNSNYMNNALRKALTTQFANSGLYMYYETMFDNCRYKRHLKFDFTVCLKEQTDTSRPNPEDVVANIEYQGGQHFNPAHEIYKKGGTCSFEDLVIRDEIKRMWCIENDIPLITKEIQSAAYVNIMAQQIYDEVMLYVSKKQKQKKIA